MKIHVPVRSTHNVNVSVYITIPTARPNEYSLLFQLRVIQPLALSDKVNQMLILIAGITGNLGQALPRVSISHGHSVRGLSTEQLLVKPSPDLRVSLKSFIIFSNYYDIPAIEIAVAGVDAVISANDNIPGLTLEGSSSSSTR